MHDEVKNGTSAAEENGSLLVDIATSDILDDNKIFIPEDEEGLRRWGFQYAIKDRNNEQLTADNLLQEYRARKKEELNQLQVIYNAILNRYREKIAFAKGELEQLTATRSLNDPTKEDLKRRKEELAKEIKEYFKKVVEVRRRLITAKQDMLNKGMDEAGAQIAKAMELQKNAYNESKEICREEFEDSKSTLETHTNQWAAKRAKYQERQDEVSRRMKLINADGVNPAGAYILIGIGTSVAAAAGYFFSIFTSTSNFSSQDAFYFLVNGFLKVGSNNEINFFVKLGMLIFVVVLISAISYGCYRWFIKLFGKQSTVKEDYTRLDAYSRIMKENSSLSAEIKAGSWFSFWLQIAPVVIILGIVILLLALNKSTPEEITRLNSSIEGVLAGTAVALGIGGLMCLYTMKIIEPRLLQRQNGDKTFSNWLWLNWELAGCMLAFIICTMAIIFYPVDAGKLGNQSTNAIAIPEFIVVSILSAFPFAYGIRFRGLIAVDRFLQREIDKLDDGVAEFKTPEKPQSRSSYRKIAAIADNILAAVQNRIMLLQGPGISGETSSVKAKPGKGELPFWKSLRGLKKIIQNIFKRTDAPVVSSIDSLIKLADWEQLYFPDLYEEITLLGAECIEKEREYAEVTNQLDKLDAEYSSNEDEMVEKTKKIQKDIETQLTYIEKAETSKIKRFVMLDLSSVRAETSILDGFHLGIWYRENQMGPTNDYYLLFTKITENGKS